jgi:hypothetical protein
MLIMRSKLFNIKIGAEDVSFGPEQIIKVFFRYMQEAIDRVRAQSRMEFVKTRMDNVDFVKVYDYSLTMLDSSQVLEKDELDALKTDIDKIKDGTPNDAQLKSYKLGFILQKRMGEDFVNKLFEGNASRDWMIRAPVAETKKDEGGLGTRLSSLLSKKEEYVSYFAYGSSMSTKRFSERLGWDAAYVTQWIATTQPRKCELKGYRLAFNKPDDANPQAGTANIVRDANGTVEGVLYQLTPAALDFLDRSEKGYRRESVKVTLGSEIEALSYVAITTKEGLKPTPEYFEQVLHGGREHGLSDAYLDSLQAIVEEPLRRAAGKPV